jgi:hypothetical protein
MIRAATSSFMNDFVSVIIADEALSCGPLVYRPDQLVENRVKLWIVLILSTQPSNGLETRAFSAQLSW